MERIRLTRDEKVILRLIHACEEVPNSVDRSLLIRCVWSLEDKGLVKGAWLEGHDLEDVRLTERGIVYICENPSLRNPVDWKWIATTIIAVLSLIVGSLALFISCSMWNK